jgi:hypothetical protein
VADGRVSFAIQLPPPGVAIAGAVITLKCEKSADKPRGKIILKGILPRRQVLSRFVRDDR